MRVLLDSHVALWWLADDDDLGANARDRIEQAEQAFVSVVTPWELGIKRALGKLTMPDDLVAQLRSGGFEMLAISTDHAERAPTLPPHHRDPFDRMLIAQAQTESLTFLSADGAIAAYEVEHLDARS